MSWNFVRKRIKGKVYLYKQRSYRDGDKVKTESLYIGPAGDAGPEQVRDVWVEPEPHKKSAPPPIDLPIEGGADPKRMLQLLEEDPPNVRRRKKSWERAHPYSNTVEIRQSAQDLNLSELSLHSEEKRVKRRMARMGLPLDDLKPMVISTARTIHRRQWLKGYHVFAQMGGGKRTTFRAEYRRALSERWFDHYLQHDPSGYSHLRADLDESYRNTRTALTQYILRGKMTNRRWLTLQMMWTKRAPEWLRDHIKAEHLGLVDHERIGTWREEAVHVTGEIVRLGPKKAAQKYARNASVAKRAANREWEAFRRMGLLDRLKGRRRQQYRKAKQADARMRATAEMSRKVTILRHHLFKA